MPIWTVQKNNIFRKCYFNAVWRQICCFPDLQHSGFLNFYSSQPEQAELMVSMKVHFSSSLLESHRSRVFSRAGARPGYKQDGSEICLQLFFGSARVNTCRPTTWYVQCALPTDQFWGFGESGVWSEMKNGNNIRMLNKI